MLVGEQREDEGYESERVQQQQQEQGEEEEEEMKKKKRVDEEERAGEEEINEEVGTLEGLLKVLGLPKDAEEYWRKRQVEMRVLQLKADEVCDVRYGKCTGCWNAEQRW